MSRVALCLACVLCLYGLNVAYNLNLFYLRGAGDDSGWFAWLATHATAWPMPNPAVQAGDFLAIHMSPIFFLTTLLLSPLSALSAPVQYSLFVSLWAPLLWLGVFLMLGRFASLNLASRAAIALLLALNGAMLSMLGLPHIEMLIPPLGVLAIVACLRADNAAWWAGWAGSTALALAVREDAGLHLCLAALAMALASARGRDRRAMRRLLALAAVCLAGSAVALAVQHLAVPGGGRRLGSVYLGQPLLAHVSPAGIGRRLEYWATRREYLFAPLAVLLILGFRARRDRLLLAGVALVLPWLGLSLLASAAQAGDLWGYYSFPLVFMILWPLLSAQPGPPPPRRLLRVQIVMGALSTASFVAIGVLPAVGGGGAHDRAPWAHLMPPSPDLIRRTDAGLAGRAGFLFDYGAAALAMGSLQPTQFRGALEFSDQDVRQARGLVRFDAEPEFEQAEIAKLEAVFPVCGPVENTRLRVCVRPDQTASHDVNLFVRRGMKP